MHELIAWVGFAGGWLLVVGPILQAAIELEEEGVDREAYADRFASIPAPKPVSPWWWLLPPVAYLLNRSRSHRHRATLVALLTRAETEQLVAFGGKATGWVCVAGGASLIAIKETFELVEAYEWPVVVFWALIPIMVAASAAYTVVRVRRGHDMIDQARGDRREAADD